MRRLLLVLLLGGAVAVGVGDTPVAAQPMAAALGKPLDSPDLPAGTVSVRVIAGALNKPVAGTDVTLFVDGAPRMARTGDDGRAIFKDVKQGAKIQALVLDEDKKEIRSEEFSLGGVGVKLMLTTAPFQGGAGAMPGGAGMPEPRQMSGEPRPEQADPAGMMTVRLTYDDFKAAAPVGVPVALVGYHANDAIDMQLVKSDDQGRAQFKGLDRTGATSYFAMTLLPREGATDGVPYERLISTPVVLDARSGVRLILSGEKRGAGKPAVDDLTKFGKQEGAPAAGKLHVSIEGGAEPGQQVSLFEITPTGPRPYGKAAITAGPPDPSQIMVSADFDAKADISANTVIVNVHGGADSTDGPLGGVSIVIAPATEIPAQLGLHDGSAGPLPPGALDQIKTKVTGATATDGSARIEVDPAMTAKGALLAIVTINGKSVTKQFAFASKATADPTGHQGDMTPAGIAFDVEAHWEAAGKLGADFDLTPSVGQVFFAETHFRKGLYRTHPFQPLPNRGSDVTLFVYPRVLFTFSLTSRIDDKFFAVSGRFEVSNNAWAPYIGSPDGLLVPLPKHFTGGLVAEKDQGDVALAQGEGFRIIRPLPPGQRQFHGAFSLPVEDGAVSWNLDLPYGSFNSGMEILQVPGMSVRTPPGVEGETANVPQGTFYVLPNISILPGQAMVMTISGLPQPPGWKIWMPRIFGVIVALIIAIGVAVALRGRRGRDAAREARRQQLLDELVELQRAGKDQKRRDEIMVELESLWDAS